MSAPCMFDGLLCRTRRWWEGRKKCGCQHLGFLLIRRYYHVPLHKILNLDLAPLPENPPEHGPVIRR